MRKKYISYRKYETLPNKVEDLEVFDYYRAGPFLVQSELFKFSSKFLSREDYHRWIDNDLREIN